MKRKDAFSIDRKKTSQSDRILITLKNQPLFGVVDSKGVFI